ncbi:NAD(P)-dependent oxidoreductase [Paraburkholderia guartelaensis]|uniref:NAD(P)-dependent oxidoreductase n=1 Tax=Paraburkholderia guartelaensis TaxID=2546446 RepID=UPI002AB65964|nr:NAD(P)-dependent oxidoreductase [Paraburkholderia guartelaensis]
MKAAIIGVGVMGSAIASRLLDVGVQLQVFDPVPGKAEPLVERGATAAASPGEATAGAEFVITSLNNANTVEQAVFGEEGIALAANPDKVLIDMSSIDPRRTAGMAARLLEQTGMGWVDAPLSGGAPAALAGTLTLMIGGDEQHVQHALPLLDYLSRNRTHMGPSGAGQTVKLINQILCANYFMAVTEAVRFAEDNGVDATRIPAALAGGRADSRILQEYMAKMARRDFTPTGRIDNMLKDLETIEVASVTQLPVTDRIAELHRMLVTVGLGASDSAEYIKLFDIMPS